MRLTQFVHLRRVDIYMDHFGVRREGIQLAGNAVVKTGADGDKQVAFLHRQICRFGTMHPQHAEVVRVICLYRTETFQRAGGGHLRGCNERAKRRNSLRHAHTTAYVQHRLFGLRHHLTRLFHLCMRERIIAFHGREMRLQIAECNLDIFRDINQNRARTARAGNLERFGHHPRQLFERLNEEAVFGAGQR